MLKFDIITIFPKIFDSYLNESILKRAREKGLISVKISNLRDFASDKHKKVDDRPFGGGPGMALKIEPLIKALRSILRISNFQFPISKQISNSKFKKTKIILFTPGGKQFDNKTAAQLAKNCDNLILICGRYEGIDARVKKVIQDSRFKIQEISMGPYVLTGGELPAMVLIDAVSRQISGVLGKSESLEEKRFGVGVPVYTRPDVFEFGGKKYRVPRILLSGDHRAIEEWRKKIAKKTASRR
ncbi:MAG: tRNA (guanosine(37)-N1)-methyltransferase TrmD [Parcubacteria group bacterium]|nr:tRNA (guanosine(37)-N1)-methyltransferase TrmD [Parcubacteria group bacterium]